MGSGDETKNVMRIRETLILMLDWIIQSIRISMVTVVFVYYGIFLVIILVHDQ